MTAPQPTAAGTCRSCGMETDHGRVADILEQVSGPGILILICPACDLSPGAGQGHDVETGRGWCEDCGLYVVNGIVLGEVSQDSGAGLKPVLCGDCDRARRKQYAARLTWLRRTDKPGRGRAS